MLRDDLEIYPNATKDCSWECPFTEVCLAMDEGLDWMDMLYEFEERIETMADQQRPWQLRLYKQHPDLYPEEYKKYCTQGVDTFEEFMEGEN